ncbi:MAG: hypothetical protein NT077_03380 [Candidatus Taylorbacteria bacterium]|nr:hypothetical protein [Candidatus Taylorbacteria bacterium]
MTPEEKSLLERTAALVQENNKILIGLRRSNRVSVALRVAYWALIIVLSFGAYYLIQPYVTMMLNTFGQAGAPSGLQNDMSQAQNTASLLRDLLK